MLPHGCDKDHFFGLPLGPHQASVCPALRFALFHCITNHFQHFLGMLGSRPIQVILPHAVETPALKSWSDIPLQHLQTSTHRSVFPLPMTITNLLFCHVLSISVSVLSFSRSQVQSSCKTSQCYQNIAHKKSYYPKDLCYLLSEVLEGKVEYIYRIIFKNFKNHIVRPRGEGRGKQEGVTRLFTNPDL